MHVDLVFQLTTRKISENRQRLAMLNFKLKNAVSFHVLSFNKWRKCNFVCLLPTYVQFVKVCFDFYNDLAVKF